MSKLCTLILVACVFLCLSETVSACPTCKQAIASDSSNVDQGFALSIMFMITMPFLIACGWTWFIVKSVLQRNRLAPTLPTPDPMPNQRTLKS